MKADDFKPFDDVADSMAAASARLGVPIEAVKAAKRGGCEAFRGSRVHLGKLREWLPAEKQPAGLSDLLLVVVHDVAHRVSYALARCPGKRFRGEYDKLCQAIQLGLGAAVCVVEPDSADEFLAESGALFESIFRKPARKKLGRIDQSKRNGRSERDGRVL
jgi:hypothetical protein